MKRHPIPGFTLIELLIVVAIIAILAAIAVPNFLEAQTRSKVSRVMADMRSIATAVEAYHVDNNHYSPMFGPGGLMFYEARYRFLTTPISYITKVPEDIFGRKFSTTDPNRPRPPEVDIYNPTSLFDYWTLEGALGISPNPAQPHNFPWNSSNYEYQLRSFGPDLLYEGANIYTTGPWAGTVIQYDPSNGTVSRGDILRWGPGGADRL
jgi:type II secretion system protein G